jgi:hypothetical protein
MAFAWIKAIGGKSRSNSFAPRGVKIFGSLFIVPLRAARRLKTARREC